MAVRYSGFAVLIFPEWRLRRTGIFTYHIMVANATSKYELDIKRNITILKGDSATGKTVLVDMIRNYVQNGPDSGIALICDIPCSVIAGNMWEEQLTPINGSIVFIDEGNLRHIIYFGAGEYKIEVLNDNKIVTNRKELLMQQVIMCNPLKKPENKCIIYSSQNISHIRHSAKKRIFNF